ncbi:MAG: hypothetical protein KC964_00355 [Candidatus Omnitrophica bacterium]|nr:hypothetical protein [Candidatus Omnitrophota bacterium]
MTSSRSLVSTGKVNRPAVAGELSIVPKGYKSSSAVPAFPGGIPKGYLDVGYSLTTRIEKWKGDEAAVHLTYEDTQLLAGEEIEDGHTIVYEPGQTEWESPVIATRAVQIDTEVKAGGGILLGGIGTRGMGSQLTEEFVLIWFLE